MQMIHSIRNGLLILLATSLAACSGQVGHTSSGGSGSTGSGTAGTAGPAGSAGSTGGADPTGTGGTGIVVPPTSNCAPGIPASSQIPPSRVNDCTDFDVGMVTTALLRSAAQIDAV